MITDRNKLSFVTIQWLWFLCLLLMIFTSNNTSIQNVEATQQQQQPQQETLQQQMKSTVQLQQDIKTNGPIQAQKQQDITVRNFSPRMDYNNEWRPVGRGDPLKNDPTFDYSPPTLDRVKYWADSDKDKEKIEEVSAAFVDTKHKKANPGKNEILLLGIPSDRLRGGTSLQQQHNTNELKNAKGETPLLQPKYTSVRRSYYAHQLPTHLMPPPMQSIVPATQQNQLQQSQMQQQHQMQTMHMVKPIHTEYRHNMPGHSYMTSSPMSSVNINSKAHYISMATQPWMHTSSSPSMASLSSSSGHSVMKMSSNSHQYSHPNSNNFHYRAPDSHNQESVNYLSYHSRPSLTSTPSIIMSVNRGLDHHDIYSPNLIRGSSSMHKLSTTSRKPWIHDLLQKEFIKPMKPTQNPNSYNVDTMATSHIESHFKPIIRPQGISTTYTPITLVTPTTPTTSTTQTVYVTSTSQQNTSTSPFPKYNTTPRPHTTQVPRTVTTLSPTRLLIPDTSNLSYRPTVAPIKMTTDSLFSHYNQPEKPLRGPMYLIIEGHSKVKTYGKDELDPHKPKIVPIIPKREPVVRIADPNERRGTPETFQVKHLHTKTTQPIETSTAVSKITTTKPQPTNAATTSKSKTIGKTATEPRTTIKPNTVTTVKPTTRKLVTTTSTTTVKPSTTKSTPKLSITTTTSAKPKVDKTIIKENRSSSKTEKLSTENVKMTTKIPNPNALEIPKKPSQALKTEFPTGMQSLLNFLDSSLDGMFKEESITNNSKIETELKETTTKLKLLPIKANNQKQTLSQIEARVSTKLEPIKSEDYEDYVDDNYFRITTEYLPRETRQIFDYDQLPELRINLKNNADFKDFLGEIGNEEDLSTFNLGDEYNDEEEEEGFKGPENTDNTHNIIKHIDSLVSDSTEDSFDDLSSLIHDDDDLTDLDRKHSDQQQQQEKKA